MRARVVVIGGGVMGVSIAWHLARRFDPHTDPVVLVEKQELAAGSSGRSGAILRQFYGAREVAALARDSLRVFAGFEKATGRSIGFMPSGVLTLASRNVAGQGELVEANVAMMRSLGIAVELVEAARIRELAHGIAVDDATIAAWEPGAGGVDPVRTVHAFAALAREHGAVTRIGRRVLALRVERARVTGVETDDGVIECEQVVVAAGPWTRALLAPLGIELPLRVVRPEQYFSTVPGTQPSGLPAHMTIGADSPARADSAWAKASATLAHARAPMGHELAARFTESEASPLPNAPHPVLLDLEHGFYARCDLHAERTRVGKMDYAHDDEVRDPDAVDERVSDEFKRWARAQLARRLPEYAREREHSAFVGLYTLTPDAQAVLGPLAGVAGLFVASGFSGHGFKLAPSIGEGVAQMVAGEPVSAFDTAFFAASRFQGRTVATPRAFGL